MKNEIVLEFCIWGFEDVAPKYITQELGIEPVKVYIKGEKKNPKFAAVAKRNGWRMGSGLDRYASFEDQMKAMLDVIESKIDLFRPFCKKYYCEFSCAIFIRYDNEESTPSVHLDARYNRLIKELNIEFDVDLYCLPNKED
jgi:hypothetical protein